MEEAVAAEAPVAAAAQGVLEAEEDLEAEAVDPAP